MPAREELSRKSRLLTRNLVALPWWVSAIAAIVCFAIFRYLLPALFATDPYMDAVVASLRITGTLFAGFFAAIALLSALRPHLRGRLLDRNADLELMREMPWQQFEWLVGEIFRLQGYVVVEGEGSADGGIDLTLRRGGTITVVQCKRWKRSVGVAVIRELLGAKVAQNADSAVLVTTSGYSSEAVRFAQQNDIELIDGPKLGTLARSVTEGPSGNAASLKQSNPPPTCPKCGAQMVRRTARRGPHAGKQFWGCSQFPKCRGAAED